MPNEYSRQWFDVFLETTPADWTRSEVEGVRRRLPVSTFRRVLDICCGPGRHAGHLAEAGYSVTGIDRDSEVIAQAKAAIPAGEFLVLDQRDLAKLAGPFDAAVILWQSYGYFDPEVNDGVLAAIFGLLRPGGRLILDLFHPGYFETRQGRTTIVRDPRCAAITNITEASHLTSTIEYVDGSVESMSWELFSPDEIGRRAIAAGFRELERCCRWDRARPPDPDEQRFQILLERPDRSASD